MAIRDRIVQLRRVRAADLVPADDNWREHPETQRKALQDILAEVGYADACLTYTAADGRLTLFDGHLRRSLDSEQIVPCLVTDLTEAEARKMMLVLDPLASLAEVNSEKLGKLIAEIETESADLRAMFDKMAVDAKMAITPPEPQADPEPQIDRAAELQKRWGTAAGQLWEIPGKAAVHRVLCGDSTKKEDVERAMGRNSPGVIITDPPYGIGWKRGVNHARHSKAQVGIENDHDTTARDMALGLFPDLPGVVFGSFYAPFPDRLKQVLVWKKPADSGLVGCVTGFRRDAEPVFLVGPWPRRKVEWSSVLYVDHGQGATATEAGHPHAKPVELILTLANAGPDGPIFDPFIGSGTTLIAAEQLSRLCYGIEISPAYVAVILQRCRDAGLTPTLTPTLAAKPRRKRKAPVA